MMSTGQDSAPNLLGTGIDTLSLVCFFSSATSRIYFLVVIKCDLFVSKDLQHTI
ncbi:unnamed protein product [Ixodes pacificus]